MPISTQDWSPSPKAHQPKNWGVSVRSFIAPPRFPLPFPNHCGKAGQVTAPARQFPQHDANFHVTAITNTSGTVQERYTPDPFGVVTFRDASGGTISASAKDWVFLHQGGQADILGHYDFRNRILSPTLGRWLTNDPLGFDAGDVNFYGYLGNGPGNGLDPSGLIDWGSSPLAGICCNNSGKPQYVIVGSGGGNPFFNPNFWKDNKEIQLLKDGECTNKKYDCDGMTCDGGFYKFQGWKCETHSTPGVPTMGGLFPGWTITRVTLVCGGPRPGITGPTTDEKKCADKRWIPEMGYCDGSQGPSSPGYLFGLPSVPNGMTYEEWKKEWEKRIRRSFPYDFERDPNRPSDFPRNSRDIEDWMRREKGLPPLPKPEKPQDSQDIENWMRREKGLPPLPKPEQPRG